MLFDRQKKKKLKLRNHKKDNHCKINVTLKFYFI